jgi:hypothetical protein
VSNSTIPGEDCGPTNYGLIERNHMRSAAPFLPLVGLGMVDKNPPQHARGNGEEMHTILPLHIGVHQAQVRFVYQRSRAQSMLRPFCA